MAKAMKFCILSDVLISKYGGSVKIYLQELLNGLLNVTKRKGNIEICLLFTTENLQKRISRLHFKDTKVFSITLERYSLLCQLLSRILKDDKILYRFQSIVLQKKRRELVKEFFKKENIDLLFIPDCVGGSTPKFLHEKTVVTLHGIMPFVFPRFYFSIRYSSKNLLVKVLKFFGTYIEDTFNFYTWKKLRLSSKIKKIIVPSDSEKKLIESILNIPEEKLERIYHGVNTEKFKPMKNKENIWEYLTRKYNLPEDEYILHLGSYQYVKNTHRLIKAFQYLKRKYKIREKLLILGSRYDYVLRKFKENELRDVIYLGWVEYEDVPKFYNIAKLFVFPSLKESFGMPVLEAAACGCPVVTSKTYATGEIGKSFAILVNPLSIESIANGIKLLLENEDLRKECSIRGLKVAKKFDWRNIAKKYIEIFENICQTT